MKRPYLLLVPAILLVLALPGCKHRPDPKEVSLKFLTAIQKANYTEAKKYATDDSKAMLDALSSFQKMLPESSQEKIKNEKFNIRDVTVRDSFAVVTYASDMDTTGKLLRLKKEHGNWKVAFTKETILPELNKPLNESDSTLMTPDSLLLRKDSARLH
ncbi:MAG TPA: hypothetical protein VFX43_15240 [Chitinophagaceae bacterium]|jgi:hypothetical protein|nr:hypothetical protein [Chitinophagaceae bacterium]